MKEKVHGTHESRTVALEMLPQAKKTECFICLGYHLRDLAVNLLSLFLRSTQKFCFRLKFPLQGSNPKDNSDD